MLALGFMFFFCGTDHSFVRFWVVEKNVGGDFENYFVGGLMIRSGVRDIYNLEVYNRFTREVPSLKDRHLNYPPVVYGMFSYFTPMGLYKLKTAWYYLNCILLAVSVLLLLAAGPMPAFTVRSKILMILYCLVFAFLFSPVQENFMMGQVNVFLLFLICLGFLFYRRGAMGAAGAMVGLAAAIKLFPGILLLFFITRRKWKAVISFVCAFLGTFLLGYLLFGPELSRSYFVNSPGGYAAWFGQSSVWLQSVPSFLIYLMSSLFPGAGVQTLAVRGFSLVIALSVLGVTFYHAYTSPEQNSRADTGLFAAFSCAIFLTSPLVWPYHLVLLLVLMPVIWHRDNFRHGASFRKWNPAFWILLMITIIGAFAGAVPNGFHPLSEIFWKFREFFLSNRLTPLSVGFLWFLCLTWSLEGKEQRGKEAL